MQGKELERGTIFESEKTNQTRFFAADRREVFFDRSSVKGIEGKLELLSPVDAGLLLEIISLEERLQVFNRQRRSEGQTEQVSHRSG